MLGKVLLSFIGRLNMLTLPFMCSHWKFRSQVENAHTDISVLGSSFLLTFASVLNEIPVKVLQFSILVFLSSW